MRDFSMGNAWSYGFRFIAGRALAHAIVLIGLGLLAPLALQFAVIGEAVEGINPSVLSRAGLTGGIMVVALMAVTYAVQTGSYFASWRLGLRTDETLAGAALYGLLGGLLAIAVLVLIGLLAMLVGRLLWSSSVPFLAILLFLLPVIVAAATFYTMPTVIIASALALVLALAMAFGAVIGNIGMAATMTGGSGAVTVTLLVLSMVTIWLAARLSCTTSLMADRRSLNLLAAMRDSWRLTFEEQWAIMRYLALIGFGLVVLIGALAVAAGYGLGAQAFGTIPAGPAQDGIIATVIQLAVAVPFAFLVVMIPAGIYREVAESDVAAAEVFA